MEFMVYFGIIKDIYSGMFVVVFVGSKIIGEVDIIWWRIGF